MLLDDVNSDFNECLSTTAKEERANNTAGRASASTTAEEADVSKVGGRASASTTAKEASARNRHKHVTPKYIHKHNACIVLYIIVGINT